MSNIGVHDFEIPHEFVQPCRDMVVIRIPFPPKFIGSIRMPDVVRDLAQHNVQAGRVVSTGPMAFTFKDGDGLQRQNVKIGDWVVIRPYAGTMIQGGKIQVTSGYRYVSSYSDILAVLPADKMPDPETLIWTEEDAQAVEAAAATKSTILAPAADNVRERTVYKKGET
jgi:co-chaperonin GroES (HSP10)